MKGFTIYLAAVGAALCSWTACAAAVMADGTAVPGAMNWNAIMAIGTIASVVLSVISGGYTWLSNRDRVTGDKFSTLERQITSKDQEQEKKIHGLELELATLKGKVEALPTEKRMDDVGKAIAAVERDLAALASTVKSQGASLEGIAASARNISDFLLQDKKEEARRGRHK